MSDIFNHCLLFWSLILSSSSAFADAASDRYGDRHLQDYTWLTSHNAFVNNGDSAWLAPNQGSLSLAEQLQKGARALMLDIYSYKNKATLCHSSCGGLPLISPRQDLSKALQTVVQFLEQNPEEIVTLLFEDYTSPADLEMALNEVPGLRNLQFDPYQADVIHQGWPKIVDMLALNKRLLLISDRGDKRFLGVGFGQELTVENYWSMGSTASDRTCRSRWDSIPLNKREPGFERLFVMNHFRDIPSTLTAAIDNRFADIWPRMEQECISAAGRRPNFIAVDYIQAASGGVNQAVQMLNGAAGILFKDLNYTGATQILLKGSLAMENLLFGNDQISSIWLFPGTNRVQLFLDGNYEGLIKEIRSSQPDLGADANDKVSSLKAD